MEALLVSFIYNFLTNNSKKSHNLQIKKYESKSTHNYQHYN